MSTAKKTDLSPTWHKHTCIDRVVPLGMDAQVDEGHEAGLVVARSLMRGAPAHQLDAGTIHVARGKEQIAVKHLHAGDIGTLTKLNLTGTTDTLGDRGHPLLADPPAYPP